MDIKAGLSYLEGRVGSSQQNRALTYDLSRVIPGPKVEVRIIYLLNLRGARGGAHGVIVIVVGNEHGDTSSNPGRD